MSTESLPPALPLLDSVDSSVPDSAPTPSDSHPRRKLCPSCQTSLAINTRYCSCGHTFVAQTPSFYRPTVFPSSLKRSHEEISSSSVALPPRRDRNEDVCAVCRDRGRLLCCDQCDLAYHIDCAGLEVIPDGIWICPNCEMEKDMKQGEKKDRAISIALHRELTAFDQAQKTLFESLDSEQARIDETDGFIITAFPPPGVILQAKEKENQGSKEETQ
jgi:hypothetical protein